MIYRQYTTSEIRLVVIGFLYGLGIDRGFNYLLAVSALEHGITREALPLLEGELEEVTRKLADGVPEKDRGEWEQRHLSLQVFIAALSEEGQKCDQEHPDWQPIIVHLEERAAHGREIKGTHELYFKAALALRRGDPALAIEIYKLDLEQEIGDHRNQSIPEHQRGTFYRQLLRDLHDETPRAKEAPRRRRRKRKAAKALPSAQT